MPITQSRMLALITAAADYKQALETITQTLADADAQVQSGALSLEGAWQLVSVSAKPVVLLTDPTNSPATIIAEAVHYKHSHRRNARKAVKQKERRDGLRGSIYTGPTTAPETIAPALHERASLAQLMREQPTTTPPGFARGTDQDQITADTQLALGGDHPLPTPEEAAANRPRTAEELEAQREEEEILAELRKAGLAK